MELTKELIEKAKNCQTAEELIALAKENGIELSPEEAALYLRDFEEGELSDEELDNVAGGQEGCSKPANVYEVIYWESEERVQFLFNIGDHVEALGFWCNHHTATCTVKNRKIQAVYGVTPNDHQYLKGYVDYYYLEKNPGVSTAFKSDWYDRSRIEK